MGLRHDEDHNVICRRLSPSGKYLISVIENYENGRHRPGPFRRVWTLRQFSASQEHVTIVHQLFEQQEAVDGIQEEQEEVPSRDYTRARFLDMDDSYVIFLQQGSVEIRSTETFDILRSISVEAFLLEYSNGFLLTRPNDQSPSVKYFLKIFPFI